MKHESRMNHGIEAAGNASRKRAPSATAPIVASYDIGAGRDLQSYSFFLDMHTEADRQRLLRLATWVAITRATRLTIRAV